LDPAAIQRFRTRYREQFGTVSDDDALYEAVSAGRRHAGMEHWLPLYYEALETLVDYLPGAAVTLDYQALDVRDTRLGTIADFYAARRTIATPNAPTYRPVKPEQLFLDEAEWAAALARRAVGELTPFAAPEGHAAAVDAGARPGRSFAEARANPKANLFEAVEAAIVDERKAGARVAIAAFSGGSADRLAAVLRERGVGDLRRAEDWNALQKLPEACVGLVVLALDQGYRCSDVLLVSE